MEIWGVSVVIAFENDIRIVLRITIGVLVYNLHSHKHQEMRLLALPSRLAQLIADSIVICVVTVKPILSGTLETNKHLGRVGGA